MPRLVAVVMAAGQGTRMKSATPKMLHDLCGWPLVRWPVEAARAAGADAVIVVGGPDRALEGHLPEGVELAVQERAQGTGDAVRSAAHLIEPDDTVIVMNGDVPLITGEALDALVTTHRDAKAAATMVTMVLPDPGAYGRVVRTAAGDVERVVEAKGGSSDATAEELLIREVNAGIYAFGGAALTDALGKIRNENVQGEYFLPDTLPVLIGEGHRVAAHVVDDANLTLGVNDRVELSRVRDLAQQRIHDQHGRAGVTIVQPSSTSIDASVEIGRDTTIEPGTVLRGATTIGANCTIGPQVTAKDLTVGDGVTAFHAYLVDSTVEDGVKIGPYVHLRGGTVLRKDARAGTFVEMKNSDVGEGSKVPHLSYLGDADVGPKTNVAASNVTANYDGKNKHRTTIGANVKTGVDNTFVAPVTIGDDAVIAAGSVITEDVPPGALGVARARQTNVTDYARRKG
ncbi:MAG TPA: bifunctional UDP-N-acetylglucosamine diphosphorylase/glucosamine-1-phosphate N-acetyltransferase GlmU [Solirubrobacteraceae bacterium]|nr:bifunctional UDP-N-acetylglucosamine diphosphorylase/glucosamine-1-phosphate N-acetyltransferase GlmU [Solirubrobacteraceae bacterium]